MRDRLSTHISGFFVQASRFSLYGSMHSKPYILVRISLHTDIYTEDIFVISSIEKQSAMS